VQGATVQATDLNLGHFSGNGTVTVTDPGSSLTLSGDASIGRNTIGHLALANAGLVTVGGDSWVAREDGSSGTVSLDPTTTLVVSGSHTHRAGGTYAVGIEPGGASGLIAVTGSADLQGGTVMVAVAPGDYPPGTQFTILSAAGGVNGAFSSVVSGSGLTFELTQDANNVYLVVGERVSVLEIPTASEWGLLLLAAVLGLLGIACARRLV
jgi:fibronectin-binding autotransporter adhesin